MSEILERYVELAERVSGALQLPAVSGIYLPPLVDEPVKEDEFGFIFLEDGSVGPFYTRLENCLQNLWQRYPDGCSYSAGLRDVVGELSLPDVASKAVALGAFNAMSHHLMRMAGYCPADSQAARFKSAARSIAVVGYIRPMVEKLLQRGLDHVLVLERNPARVEETEGLRLSSDPADLGDYDEIICTASTLINDSIGEILAYRKPASRLTLVGPSGSGLADVLFSHGVDEIGGFWLNDRAALDEALEHNHSWGDAGSKYSLTPESYPGIDKLLELAGGHR